MALFDAHPRLRATAFEKAVRDRVNDSKALTSRGTMVLYWLLRKHEARDFLYDVNLEERAAELKKRYPVEALLEEAVAPERQHIVPYKRLKMLFGLEGGARPGRHDVHDIGNLTYISSGLNGFVLGVGSRPLKLDAEETANREAHCLPGELLDPYRRLAAVEWGHLDRAKRQGRLRDYRSFCSVRRRWIQQRIVEWERELRDAASGVSTDANPSIRLIEPRVDDLMRLMGFPDDVTAALVGLCDGGRPQVREDGDALRVSLPRRNGKSRIQMLRVEVRRRDGTVVLKLRDGALRQRFVRQYPGFDGGLDHKYNLHLDVRDSAASVIGILNWLAQQKSRAAGEPDRQP